MPTQAGANAVGEMEEKCKLTAPFKLGACNRERISFCKLGSLGKAQQPSSGGSKWTQSTFSSILQEIQFLIPTNIDHRLLPGTYQVSSLRGLAFKVRHLGIHHSLTQSSAEMYGGQPRGTAPPPGTQIPALLCGIHSAPITVILVLLTTGRE